MGKVLLGCGGQKWGWAGSSCWGSPSSESFFQDTWGRKVLSSWLPKPASLLSQTHSLAYLFNGEVDRSQPNLRPGQWPLLQPSLAQPGKMAGWALSKGPRPARTRLLDTDPCGPQRSPAVPCCLGAGGCVGAGLRWISAASAGDWVRLTVGESAGLQP